MDYEIVAKKICKMLWLSGLHTNDPRNVAGVVKILQEAAQQERAADGSKREPTIIKEFPMRDAYPAGYKPKRRR